jgi:uncharacterized protein YjeT (DUF2065 family)
MRQINREEGKKFSIDQFFAMAICFVVLTGLTVVCLLPPALDALDKWMDNLVHQVCTLVVVVIIAAGAWVYWWIKRS